MANFHLTQGFLWALHAGDRDPGDLVSQVMSHLFDLCPECEAAVRAFQAELRDQAGGAYDQAFERARETTDAAVVRVAHEKEDAAQTLAEILTLQHDLRLDRIESDPDRFRGSALGSMLIEHAIEKLPGQPRESKELAQLARAVLQRSELTPLVSEEYARATAYVANAWRIQGQLLEAKDLFETVRFILKGLGGGTRTVMAEIDWMEGILCRDRRNFRDAVRLQRRAAMIFIMEENPGWANRCLLSLAVSHRVSGQPLEAIRTVEEVLASIPAEGASPTLLYARHLLSDCLCDAGLFLEAAEVLAENRTGYEQIGDPLSLLRLSWVEGKIARGLGNLREAETLLKTAQNGFRSREFAYDTALVSLELASMYLQQGRAREVQSLAVEMVEVFQRLEIHREALAALMLFEDAAKLQQVTLSWIENLTRYMAQAQRDPSLAFQAAS